MRRDSLWAGCILALLLVAMFLPAVLGTRTLLASAWTAPSVMPSGAYHEGATPPHQRLSPDPGAPAWTLEPWIKVIGEQYLREKQFPLWNPYNAYGTPFAAAMQPQPFFPLTALLSLHPTPWTYNIFIIARLLLAGILTFLFARLFLDYAAAVFASIAFMLNGYFIIFLDMPHLSVEVLLPGSIPYLRAFVAKDFMAKSGSRRWDDLLVHMRRNARISRFWRSRSHAFMSSFACFNHESLDAALRHGQDPSYCRCCLDLRSRLFCCSPLSNLWLTLMTCINPRICEVRSQD